MQYRATNGTTGIVTEHLAVIIQIARHHISQEVNETTLKWRWTVEADSPEELLSLLETCTTRDRVPAQPTDAYGVDHGDINGTANLIAT